MGTYQLRETTGTILAFNSHGSLASEQDSNGNTITAGYDGGGRLISLTATNESAIKISYNAQGLVDQVTDPAGRESTYAYDSAGHLVGFTDRFGTTTYTYVTGHGAAQENALASITFSDGTSHNFAYDAQGRLIEQGLTGGADPINYTYGPAGGFSTTNGDGDLTSIRLDDRGLICQTIDARGFVERLEYDAQGDLLKTIAPDGATTSYSYDSRGNVLQAIDPLGGIVNFTYDPTFDEIMSYQDQRGNTTSYAYDGHGNLTRVTFPDGSTQQFAHDSLGELDSYTDARGQTTTYAYNAAGQLTIEDFYGGTSNFYTYDTHGNLLRADGPGGDWSMTYNAQDMPSQISEPNGTLSVTYTTTGIPISLTDQNGFTVHSVYNSVGQLGAITDAKNQTIDAYTYDQSGQLIGELKGNGTSTKYGYDTAGDITQITNLAADGQTVNSQFTYAYDALGRVSSMIDGGGTTTYGYNADGELTSVSAPGQSVEYTYDPAGNRSSMTLNGVVTQYSANNRNEYTQVGNTTYTFDADGNMTSKTAGGTTTTYAYDSRNQLVGVQTATDTFSYAFDALGFLISDTHNGQSTKNLSDPFSATVFAQFDATGSLLAHYTSGLGLVSRVDGEGQAAYFEFNLEGSTVGITGANGTYINRYSYDPFGQVTTLQAAVANPFTFVGQYGVSSDGNGLYLMLNRSFDPATGQFVSQDPINLLGGDTNLRRYADNDPIDYFDPAGLDPIKSLCKIAQKVKGYGGKARSIANKVKNPSQDPLGDLVKTLGQEGWGLLEPVVSRAGFGLEGATARSWGRWEHTDWPPVQQLMPSCPRLSQSSTQSRPQPARDWTQLILVPATAAQSRHPYLSGPCLLFPSFRNSMMVGRAATPSTVSREIRTT